MSLRARKPRSHDRAAPLECLTLGKWRQALTLYHVRDFEAEQIEHRRQHVD
jgi:hypothetical protein